MSRMMRGAIPVIVRYRSYTMASDPRRCLVGIKVVVCVPLLALLCAPAVNNSTSQAVSAPPAWRLTTCNWGAKEEYIYCPQEGYTQGCQPSPAAPLVLSVRASIKGSVNIYGTTLHCTIDCNPERHLGPRPVIARPTPRA